MKHSTLFTPTVLSLAVSAAMFSQQVIAEDAVADEIEVISVKGIRGSLIRSQATKMENTSIVEAISAEDIGKLPDSSIAESLSMITRISR